MRKIRKGRDLDNLSNNDDSNGSTTGQSTEAVAAHHMKKSNFLEDIQKLQTSEDAQVLLEFDSTECVELSLI